MRKRTYVTATMLGLPQPQPQPRSRQWSAQPALARAVP